MKEHLSLDFSLGRDGVLLFSTRMARLFAYGMLATILVLYLTQLGLTGPRIGLLLTLTMAGDVVISLWIAMTADRSGRRKMLMTGAALMVFAGVVFALSRDFRWLLVAATVGVISPSAGEVGPFLSIELATLSHITREDQRTQVLAWYNLLGSLATAAGSVAVGVALQALRSSGMEPVSSYKTVVASYAAIGLLLLFLFGRLSPSAEVKSSNSVGDALKRKFFGLHRSQGMVLQLSGLFALDSFAGGFILQSITAYWFATRFGAAPVALGAIFFCSNLLAGLSSLGSAALSRRIGLIRTMVFTHIPANVLLILVPLMPNLPLAVALFLLRSCFSSMDVPARQSYTMAVVDPDERSATAGITNVSRNIGTSLSPLFVGPLLSQPALLGLAFFLGGGIKIVYDLSLYYLFRSVEPPEERRRSKRSGGKGRFRRPHRV